MNWNDIKLTVISYLDQAEVTGEARKTIIRFERKLTTCRNQLQRGTSWARMTESNAYCTAMTLMDRLNECGEFGMEDAEFFKEWSRYQETRNGTGDCNLGDLLC